MEHGFSTDTENGTGIARFTRPVKYGRMVGVVTLPDGRVLNHALVRAGHAWWYAKYAASETDLQAMETEAREAGRGLWSGPIPCHCADSDGP